MFYFIVMFNKKQKIYIVCAIYSRASVGVGGASVGISGRWSVGGHQ